MDRKTQDRRAFLTAAAGALAAWALTPAAGVGARVGPTPGRSRHPEPRPGVDGSGVLVGDAVPAHLAELFEGVRAIPHVVDGIRCSCGCADLPDMYSLLSCYEGMGMARYCTICQGAGRLACRMAAEGRPLDEIRAAVDRTVG